MFFGQTCQTPQVVVFLVIRSPWARNVTGIDHGRLSAAFDTRNFPRSLRKSLRNAAPPYIHENWMTANVKSSLSPGERHLLLVSTLLTGRTVRQVGSSSSSDASCRASEPLDPFQLTIDEHEMHSEFYQLSEKLPPPPSLGGGRVNAVGTSTAP